MAGSAWNVQVGIKLDTGDIEAQLKKHKYTLDTKTATAGLRQVNAAGQDINMTFNAANMIFSRSVAAIKAMVNQTYELNSSMTEFKKVSDLRGEGLDNYVEGLTQAGKTVSRTGSDMVNAAAQFRKSGFNDEDAAQLATVAA